MTQTIRRIPVRARPLTQRKLDQCRAVKSAALTILHKIGRVETNEDKRFVRGMVANIDGFHILYLTPFTPPPPTPDEFRYRFALNGIPEMLPYQLNIWSPEKKTMAFSWNAEETDFVVMTFHRGSWIDQLTACAMRLNDD